MAQSLDKYESGVALIDLITLYIPTKQTRDPALVQCWASVADGGPTLNQRCVPRSLPKRILSVPVFVYTGPMCTPLWHTYAISARILSWISGVSAI